LSINSSRPANFSEVKIKFPSFFYEILKNNVNI
jgi:hypothetical protein